MRMIFVLWSAPCHITHRICHVAMQWSESDAYLLPFCWAWLLTQNGMRELWAGADLEKQPLHLRVLGGPVAGPMCHSESGMPASGSCIESTGRKAPYHIQDFSKDGEAAASPMSLCSLPHAFWSSPARLQGKPALLAMQKGIFTTFPQVKSLSSLNFT